MAAVIFVLFTLFWSSLFLFFTTKQSSTRAWRRVCSLSSRYALGISKKASGVFGSLTSKVQSVLVCWHLDEAG